MHSFNVERSMSDSDTTMNQTTAAEGAEQQSTHQPTMSPGAQLAAQREALSWTIEQVANQLNLAPRQIQALEADNYAALPGMAVVRGFTRSYAKLLKLDVEPLLATIAADTANTSNEALPSRRTLSTPFSENSHLPLMNRHGSPSKSILAMLAIVVLGAGGFAAYQMGWLPTGLNSSAPRMQESASVPAFGQVTVPDVATSAPADATSSDANNVAYPGVPVPAEPSSVNSAITANATPSPAVTSSNADAETRGAPPATKDALVLKLREDSWVEIKRSNPGSNGANNILIARLVKAGSTETFEITDPVSVTIGNASGVDVSFRGAPLNIKSGLKTNIARLNLK
jgi:cytoskeleton protein RodZ